MGLSWEDGYPAGFEGSAMVQRGKSVDAYSQRLRSHLRTFEPAFPSRFPALITYGLGGWVRITLNLLLAASQAGKSKAFSRPAGLRYPPICVDGCTVDEFGAGRSVCIYEAKFPVDDSLVYHMRAKGLVI